MYIENMNSPELEDAKTIQSIIKGISRDVRNDAVRRGVRVTYMRDGAIYAWENGQESLIRSVAKGPAVPMPKSRGLRLVRPS